MGISERLKDAFRREHKPVKAETLPKGWGGQKSKPKAKEKIDVFTKLKHGKSSKFHVPGLKLFNQLLLVVLLAFNFFISQAALTGGGASQVMALLFLGNSYGLFYGLWKSRKEPLKIE